MKQDEFEEEEEHLWRDVFTTILSYVSIFFIFNWFVPLGLMEENSIKTGLFILWIITFLYNRFVA